MNSIISKNILKVTSFYLFGLFDSSCMLISLFYIFSELNNFFPNRNFTLGWPFNVQLNFPQIKIIKFCLTFQSMQQIPYGIIEKRDIVRHSTLLTVSMGRFENICKHLLACSVDEKDLKNERLSMESGSKWKWLRFFLLIVFKVCALYRPTSTLDTNFRPLTLILDF